MAGGLLVQAHVCGGMHPNGKIAAFLEVRRRRTGCFEGSPVQPREAATAHLSTPGFFEVVRARLEELCQRTKAGGDRAMAGDSDLTDDCRLK